MLGTRYRRLAIATAVLILAGSGLAVAATITTTGDFTGGVAWQQQYDQNERDVSSRIAVDDAGAVIVPGATAGADDGWVRKYTADGTPAWTVETDLQVTAAATDSQGNVVATMGIGQASPERIRLAKYTSDGREIWNRSRTGEKPTLSDVTVTASDAIVIAGQSGSEGDRETFVAKIASNGTPVWTSSFHDLGGNVNAGTGGGLALTIDSTGRIVTAVQDCPSSGCRTTILTLDAAGDVLYNRTLDHANRSDVPSGVAVGPQDEIVVTSAYRWNDSIYRSVSKLTADGALLWNRTFRFERSGMVTLTELDVADTGAVALPTFRGDDVSNFTVITLTADGRTKWNWTWNASQTDIATGAAWDGSKLYTSGVTLNAGDDLDAVTFELRPQALDVAIDVKPGSDTNPVATGSGHTIPVAVLATDRFDPLDRVDVDTVRFGDPEDVAAGGGAAPAHAGHSEDVDDDGDDDLVLHFPSGDAGFDGDEDEGELVGETDDGTAIQGTDDVTPKE